jgi:hypothetical protein
MESILMMKRHVLWTALTATLALTACGGGSDNVTEPPPPVNPPPPPLLPVVDRIEPLDTSFVRLAPAPKAAPALVSRMPAGAPVQRVVLGPLDGTKAAAQKGNGAQVIGQGRAVADTASAAGLAAKLQWNALADGSQVAALAFDADGAQGVRLGVLAQQLPDGAVLRFYGVGGNDVFEMSAAQVAALRQTNEEAGLSGDAARMVWGPDTAGAVSTLEVQIPAGADASQVQLAVPRLSHLTQTAGQVAAQDFAKAFGIGATDTFGTSYTNVMCVNPLPAESRAVVYLEFVTDSGGSSSCSGTLMNDSTNSRRPFVLTAAHCMPDQAAASSLITRYFYRAAGCNTTPPNAVDPAMTRVNILGARYLQADDTVDSSLVELNDTAVPPGVVYAGSYFGYQDNPNTPELDPSPPIIGGNTPVIGIHHPLGDLQKFSLGVITDFSMPICGGLVTDPDFCADVLFGFDSGNMYLIQWNTGSTDEHCIGTTLFGCITSGSSGSAVFAAPRLVSPPASDMRYVIGVASRANLGDDPDNNPLPSAIGIYGRFDLGFYRGFNRWLMPATPPAQ